MTTEPVALFDRYVPNDAQQAMMRCVGRVYSESYHHCRAEYPPEELAQIYPQTRWAKLEYSLRMLVLRFDGMSARPVPNGNGHHTEVTAGRVVMTASAVPTPGALPRNAVFRKTLARSPQISFPFARIDPPHPDDPLYAFLLHGPDLNEPWRPAFLSVAFPNDRCDAYLGRIDLCARFPDVARAIWFPDAELVGDDANPLPLPAVRSKRRGA